MNNNWKNETTKSCEYTGLISSAIFTFIGYKRQTDKQSIYIDKRMKGWINEWMNKRMKGC